MPCPISTCGIVKVTMPSVSMRTKAFGAKSAFDSAASTVFSRRKERLRTRAPPAAAVAFTNVRRLSFGAEEIEAMDPVSFMPTGRLA